METAQTTARILVVDDNPEIREILHILLGGEGYEIDEARDGASALKQTETAEYDLIILDIMMPGMNGYQTCREIKMILPEMERITVRRMSSGFMSWRLTRRRRR